MDDPILKGEIKNIYCGAWDKHTGANVTISSPTFEVFDAGHNSVQASDIATIVDNGTPTPDVYGLVDTTQDSFTSGGYYVRYTVVIGSETLIHDNVFALIGIPVPTAILSEFTTLDARYINAAGDDMSGQLDIIDSSGAQLRLEHTEDTKFADFSVDTNANLTIKPSSTGQVILQPTTDSTDFFQILDADGGTPILNVDASNERVGIGTASPTEALEVNGSILVLNGDVHIGTPPSGFEAYEFTVNSALGGIILKRAGTNEPFVQLMNDTDQCGSIRGLNGGGLRFMREWPDEGFRLTSAGYVGIGTTDPDRRLDVLDATYPQLRLTHTDGTIYTDFQVEPDGDLSIEPTGDNINLIDKNISLGTTTGSKIGTAASQKLGFFGAVPVVQLAKTDYNNWAALSDLLDALVVIGLIDAA